MPKPLGTYALINTTTLATTTTTVTFSDIPQTYTDLVIVSNFARVTSNGQNLGMRINGDTGSNYSTTYLEGNGSSGGCGKNSNDNYGRVGAVGGGFALSTSDLPMVALHIIDYTNTATNKTTLSRYGQSGTITGISFVLWRSTAAINSISLSTFNTGQFGSGSTFKLYGITAGNQ